jgi:hypothetical protein
MRYAGFRNETPALSSASLSQMTETGNHPALPKVSGAKHEIVASHCCFSILKSLKIFGRYTYCQGPYIRAATCARLQFNCANSLAT